MAARVLKVCGRGRPVPVALDWRRESFLAESGVAASGGRGMRLVVEALAVANPLVLGLTGWAYVSVIYVTFDGGGVTH